MRQRTLQRSVEASGIGLHSGEAVRLVMHPAPVNTGVVFRRVDITPVVDIPARARCVDGTTLSTTLKAKFKNGLKSGDVHVATVEHLLAALSGLGVDNVIVDVDAQEIPIMDGSAAPFVALLQSAGSVEQSAPKQFIRVLREVAVTDGDKSASFLPFEGFKVSFTIDFEQPVFRKSSPHAEMIFSTETFVRDVSLARTFGFLDQVESLRSRGLAMGGSFDNVLVVDDYQILNADGLRTEDEFVQHKVLDAIGDLSLLGHALIGEYRACKSGHTLNNQAVRALLGNPDAWELVSFEAPAQAPLRYGPTSHVSGELLPAGSGDFSQALSGEFAGV